MDEQILLSKKEKKQERKDRRRLLKRLKKSYTVCVNAWEALNYQDLYFDNDLGMTEIEFEEFQKKVANTLGQICKIRQKKIFEILYGGLGL